MNKRLKTLKELSDEKYDEKISEIRKNIELIRDYVKETNDESSDYFQTLVRLNRVEQFVMDMRF